MAKLAHILIDTNIDIGYHSIFTVHVMYYIHCSYFMGIPIETTTINQNFFV